MVQLVIPGAVQVSIKMECSGQEVFNVIGVNGNFGENLTSVLTDVKTAWEAVGGPLRIKPSALRVVSYKAVALEPDGAIAEIGSTATGGLTTGTIATMASSALIILGGGTRNRSARGRLYHGPLHEGDINPDGRQLNTTFITAATAAYTQFRNQLNTSGNQWTVLSRKTSTAAPVESLSVAAIIATQRRRQR